MYTPRYFIFLILLLAAANFAAHGHALWDGLFLDDHWHALRLAESNWSISELLDATTIAPDRFMGMWWQEKPVSWWYVRPFAVLVAKVVYHLSDGSVKALHAVSIVLHGLNALMVHHLVLRMSRRRFWAVVAALLVVVYSHSVYAVAWLAAQNALLQTTLMLAGLILYVRASRLDLYAAPRDEALATELQPEPAPRLSLPALAGFFVCWGLALLSRESAVILPVFAVAFDLAFGGRHWLRARLPAYAVMVAVAGAFTIWRVFFFDHPMPDFYVQRPAGPEYILWWTAKLLNYLTATVWLSPMSVGPSGRFNPWRETPGDIVLMFVILSIMSLGYYMATRRLRGYWIWPLWILLGILPVVPILATPHNGYLPSMGFAIAMAIGPALRHETKPTSIGRWCTGVAIWFLIATTTYMPIYRPMWYSVLAAERMTIDQVVEMPPPPQVRDVFFINLPFVNIYATYHLDEAFGRGPKLGVYRQDDPIYRTHVLTYAPDLLRMEAPCRLEQVDAHRFRVSIESDRPYFSGALGRFLIEGLRPSGGRLRTGDRVTGDLFDVTIHRADERGVRELEFAFRKPLASPEYCFYVGTPSRAATRVRFAGPITAEDVDASAERPSPEAPSLEEVRSAAARLRNGDAQAAHILFRAAECPPGPVRDQARAAVTELCLPVAQALAAPVVETTPSGLTVWADASRVSRWWADHVDEAAVRILPGQAERYADMRWQRDALFRIRRIAGTIIQADLYLTGPPFPGPR
ncbi:MAG TPA: hypothetical protein PL151_14545 [Phycisphaerae bacterium]|nr:hypothetical protein [Phycisphaerae bacterium]HOM50085.1 hypothetical protein [Phycisphaerae bacterium]HON68472.1 hypothetical protein [Phycisphaerae bacterium]HPP26612.1 hypothetical protein [Phycisphaerae bacterium]HQE28976.1 hypothetical protein [Phycisphaerae bacterium]